MKRKFLSFMLSLIMILSSVLTINVTAADSVVKVSDSSVTIDGINKKADLCSDTRDVTTADFACVLQGDNYVHKYSVKKTAANARVQELYDIQGLDGINHIASYDLYFESVYLDEASKDSETILAFRGYDNAGSGSSKDYSPYIDAVVATKNGEGAATLKTSNGDNLNYNTWYTFYMVSELNGGKLSAKLYYKAKDSECAVAYIGEDLNYIYNRDGVLSHLYFYLLSDKLDEANASVFYVDNVTYAKQEILSATPSLFDGLFTSDDKVSADFYISPGFESCKVYIDGKHKEIYNNSTGIYNITADLSSLADGEHKFKIVALYGDATVENSVVYEKTFVVDNNKGSVQNANRFENGVFEYGKDINFVATPSGSTTSFENNSVKVSLSDSQAGTSAEYIKIPFYTSGTTYYNAAALNKSHTISFDMKLDGIVAASASSQKLMQIRGLANGAWTSNTHYLTISKSGNNTVINSLDTDYIIEQNAWYTFSFVTNPGNNTYNVYCCKKGDAKPVFLATVTDTSAASINGIALGFYRNTCQLQSADEASETPRIAPDIYLDNLFIRETVKVDGRNISLKSYTTDDVFKADTYITPGFDSASISIGKEIYSLCDNNTGFYTVEKSLENCEIPSAFDFKIHVKYGDNVIEDMQSVNVAAKTNYSLHKAADGTAMYYPVDGASSADGVFPCMTMDVTNMSSFSLDNDKNGVGKALKVTYTSSDSNKYCNFGYINNQASAIANDRYTKISMDVKFGASEFMVKVQNKFNNAWLSAGSSKEFIDKYGRVQQSTLFYYEPDRWYNLSYVVDTVKGEGRIYLDNEYVCTNALTLPEIENPTQLQFCIAHKTASATSPKDLWVDNLKVETSPYYFIGYEGNKYETIEKSATDISLTPVSNPGSGIIGAACFGDGTNAGEVSVNADSGAITLSSTNGFDASKDITLKLIDANDGKILAQKTYAFINDNGAAINDVSISLVCDEVRASVYAAGGNDGTKSFLIVASYNDLAKIELADISIVEIPAVSKRTEFFSTLPANSGRYYVAYVWDNGYDVPLKKTADLSLTD